MDVAELIAAVVTVVLAVALPAGGVVILRKTRKGGVGVGSTIDIRIALHVASHEAHKRGHAQCAPEHFLLAALEHDDVAAAVTKSSSGVAEMRERLLARLDGIPRAPRADELKSSPELNAIFQRAAIRARNAKRSTMTITDAVASMAEAPGCAAAQVWTDAAVNIGDLESRVGEQAKAKKTRELVPYRAEHAPRAATVVFWNDGKTSMMVVMEVLQKRFALAETRAMHLMWTVHFCGAAAVGVFEDVDAEMRAKGAMDDARARGMPLRVTVETDWRGPPTPWKRIASLFSPSAPP